MSDLVDGPRDAGHIHMALFQLQQAAACLKGNVSEDIGVQPAASGCLSGCWRYVYRHAPQVTQLQSSLDHYDWRSAITQQTVLL